MKTLRTLSTAASLAALALLISQPAHAQYSYNLSSSYTAPIYFQGPFGFMPYSQGNSYAPYAYNSYSYFDSYPYGVPEPYPYYGPINADAAAQQADAIAAQDPGVPVAEAPSATPATTMPVADAANVLPRTSDSIEAQLQPNGQIYLAWQGDPTTVRQISFALLDHDRRVITKRTIYNLPAERTLTLTSKTSYYQVTVQYLNGTTNTVTAPAGLVH